MSHTDVGPCACDECWRRVVPNLPVKGLVAVEQWHSSENRREVHFFLRDTQVYLFGFNPGLLRAADVEAFVSAALAGRPDVEMLIKSISEHMQEL